MKGNSSKLGIRIGALCIACVLTLTSFFTAQATKTVDELENDASDLNSELSGLNNELEVLEKELDGILSEIENISGELEITKEELAVAKGLEEAQYESMKLRIQYMYENGNSNMLDMLFSSSCMAEFLNRAEYYSKLNEYDRDLLNELEENREQIAEKEAKLLEDQKYLSTLQDNLAAKEKELETKISATSSELASCTAKLEEAKEAARKAEEEAKKKVEPIVPDTSTGENSNNSGDSKTETTYGDSVSFSEEDVVLLAGLLECEAGSSNYEALLAVGSVVVNRMKSRYYPDTVYGVVYQSGQFPPAHNGKLDSILERGVRDLCVTAARDALNGKNNVGDCLQFRSSSSSYDGLVIGGNVFF